jgi:hypothetical protein
VSSPSSSGTGKKELQSMSIDYLRLYYCGRFSGALAATACDAWLAVLFYLLGDTASGIRQCNSLLEIVTVDGWHRYCAQ